LRPDHRRQLVNHLLTAWDVSERRGCGVLCVHRSLYRYQSQADDQALLRMRIREIAFTRVRYGYKRIYVLLRREGWRINHKRVYRLYCMEGLNLRGHRPKRRKSAAHRKRQSPVTRPNECWSMDFMSDALFDGRRIKLFTIVDNYTRESLAIEVGSGMKGHDVVQVLERISDTRALPNTIRLDNGPEFTSKVLDKWAYEKGVTLDFSRPGKPTDNGYIESFNGRFREECLNTNWFLSLMDAQDKIGAWREDYNVSRPHMSLDYMTPLEFASHTGDIPGMVESKEAGSSP